MVLDYSKGAIYIISLKSTDKIYIGSTIQGINIRFSKHKSEYKLYLNNQHRYNTSFEILKYNDAKVALKEPYPCSSRRELEERESYWVEYYKDVCVNKIKPGSKKSKQIVYKIYKLVSPHTVNIYVGHTQQKLVDRKRGHKKDYKNYLKEKYHYNTSFELYNLGIKDVDIVYLDETDDPKQVHILEQYYMDLNKDIILNKNRAYRSEEEKKEYEQNRTPKWQANNSTRCICGGRYSHSRDRKRHLKTRKHLDFVNKIANIHSDSIKCECGGYYKPNKKTVHFKTTLHQNYIEKYATTEETKKDFKLHRPIHYECSVCNKSIAHHDRKRHFNSPTHIKNLFKQLPY